MIEHLPCLSCFQRGKSSSNSLSTFSIYTSAPFLLLDQSKDGKLTVLALQVMPDINQKFGTPKLRKEIVSKADELEFGDLFRFLIAIVDWEEITDMEAKSIVAYKIKSTFVDRGSRQENAFSQMARDILGDFRKKTVSSKFYEEVKVELIKYLLQDPVKRVLIGLSLPALVQCEAILSKDRRGTNFF